MIAIKSIGAIIKLFTQANSKYCRYFNDNVNATLLLHKLKEPEEVEECIIIMAVGGIWHVSPLSRELGLKSPPQSVKFSHRLFGQSASLKTSGTFGCDVGSGLSRFIFYSTQYMPKEKLVI